MTQVWPPITYASKICDPNSPSIATKAKSEGWAESRAAVSRASNCRCESPSVGDSLATRGLRTYSAGECSRNAVDDTGALAPG